MKEVGKNTIYEFLKDKMSDGEVHEISDLINEAKDKYGVPDSVIASRIRIMRMNCEVERVDRGQYKLIKMNNSIEKYLDRKIDNIVREIDTLKVSISEAINLSDEARKKLLFLKELRERIAEERGEDETSM